MTGDWFAVLVVTFLLIVVVLYSLLFAVQWARQQLRHHALHDEDAARVNERPADEADRADGFESRAA